MVTGTLRHADQSLRLRLQLLRNDLRLLPGRYTSCTGIHELGDSNVLGRHDDRNDLLFGARKEGVRGTCGICAGKAER